MAVLAAVVSVVSGFIASAGTLGSILLSVGFTAASQLLNKPKRGQAASQITGRQLSLATATDVPNTAVIGKMAVGGSLVFRGTYGTDNAFLYMVINLADHECDALDEVIVNGKKVVWNQTTGFTSKYGSYLRIKFFNGSSNQSADPELVNNMSGKWTANHKGLGRCYVVVRLKYSDDVWASGFPDFRWVLRGAKLYDWRLDSTNGGDGQQRHDDQSTWQYSDNPVVAYVNYIMGIYVQGVKRWGRNVPIEAIDLNAATAAANSCDEPIAVLSGGSEKRYTIGTTISANTNHLENEKMILETFMGSRISTGGFTRIQAGVPQVPVMSFTDDDRVVDSDIIWSPKLTADQLVNTVKGKFSDPKQNYEPGSQLARASSVDIQADGGELSIENDFEGVTSSTQCQRLMEILRREARLQGRLAVTYGAKAEILEVGDWVYISSQQFGWENKTFEVVKIQSGGGLIGANLEMREIYSNVFDWSFDYELQPGDDGELPEYLPPVFSINNVQVYNFDLITPDGETRPGLDVRWSAIDDSRVTSVVIEYRIFGENNALTTESFDPNSGAHQFINGVLGNVTYEVRARAVSRTDANQFVWSGWVKPDNDELSGEIIISRAVYADKISNPIDYDDLSVDVITRLEDQAAESRAAQTAAEFSLAQSEITAEAVLSDLLIQHDSIQATQSLERNLKQEISNSNAEFYEHVQILTNADQAAASSIGVLNASVDDNNAEIISLEQTVVNNNQQTALSVTQLTTRADDTEITVQEQAASINGISAHWGVAIGSDGVFENFIKLDGSADSGAFTVRTDQFNLLLNDPNNQSVTPEPVNAFTAYTNSNGDRRFLFNGDIEVENLKGDRLEGYEIIGARMTASYFGDADGNVVIDSTDPDNVVWQIGQI